MVAQSQCLPVRYRSPSGLCWRPLQPFLGGSVFMTVGDADTFWHPQFFSTVTFESQRSTEEERSWSLLQPL